MPRILTICALVLVACGDDGVSPPIDSGPDAADAGPDSATPLVSAVETGAPPDFSPCPPGWRLVPHPTLDLEVCEPWPDTGPADCLPHEMHLPGTPGCTRVGSECPADGWPTSLPASGVVFVRADAPAGGDGSRAAPYQTLVEAAASTADGEVVALAVGRYDGRVEVDGALTVIGACAEGVVLVRTDGAGGLPIVNIVRDGSLDIRDVTLRSERQARLLAMFADITIRDSVFDGVGIVHFGGSVTIEDVRFGGVADDTLALVSVSGADDARVSRVVIRDTNVGALTVIANDSVAVSDLAVTSCDGIGVQLTSNGGLTAERVVVEDSEDLGITLDGRVTGEDLLVRGVRTGTGRTAGISSIDDADLTRVRVEDAGDVALSLVEGTASVRDLVLFGGRGGSEYERGLELGDGVNATLSRVAVAAVNDLAFLVSGEGTSLDLSDALVDDVASGPGGGFGRCIHAQLGAAASTHRTRFTRCREAAVTASTGASVLMRDALVDRVLPLGCSSADCPDAQAGIGFVALEGEGVIDVERFVVSEAALAGVQVIAGGEIDLHDGTIRNNPVGINVQVDGYDIGRLMDRVVFEDNGLNLDSSELPVPAATATMTVP